MIVFPQCIECKHFHNDNFNKNTCDAYEPKEIPFEIISNQIIHNKPYKQKNKIIFEPLGGKKYEKI